MMHNLKNRIEELLYFQVKSSAYLFVKKAFIKPKNICQIYSSHSVISNQTNLKIVTLRQSRKRQKIECSSCSFWNIVEGLKILYTESRKINEGACLIHFKLPYEVFFLNIYLQLRIKDIFLRRMRENVGQRGFFSKLQTFPNPNLHFS